MNVRSFDEGEKKHSSSKRLSHEADPMVDKLIDAPLQKKCFCYLSVSCKNRWFLPVEFSICGLGGNGVRVIVCYVLADVADRLGPGGGFLRCQRVPNTLGNNKRVSIGNLCTMTLVESTMAERQQATYAQCH